MKTVIMSEKELNKQIKMDLKMFKMQASFLKSHVSFLDSHLKVVNERKGANHVQSLQKITDVLEEAKVLGKSIEKFAADHASKLMEGGDILKSF